jgi:hypothetical protein
VIAAPDTVPPAFTLGWDVPLPDPDNPAARWNLIEATGHTVGADDAEGMNQQRWSADGWSWSTARAHSATHSWFGGNESGKNSVLVSRRAHRVQPGEPLRFWTWYNIQNGYDYGYVEVATDPRSFAAISGSITTDSNPNRRNIGNGITGSSHSQWVQATFDLSAYEGQTIWIRFRYNTNGSGNSGGWYLDDIEPSDLFATEFTIASGLTQPEYTFADHPEGVFAYLAQAVDGEGDPGLWSVSEIVTVSGTSGVGETASAWRGLEAAGSNPFSGSAALRFTVPTDARGGEPLRLSVYDVEGREVACLRAGSVGAGSGPGRTVESTWRPEGPSGIYFARLVVGDRSSEMRLVYLR